MNKLGTLYGIGVGPGDPELITIKGHKILQRTKIISFPETSPGAGSYAGAIIENLIDVSTKQLLPLVFPMTRDKAALEEKWDIAVDCVLEPLLQGEDVVFVSEGDPLFFSTFIHLMEKVKHKKPSLKIEVIPGISSMLGAASALGWGLAIGDEKFAVIPATADMEDMSAELDRHDTVVFYKIAKVLTPLIDLLKRKNLAGKSAIVSKATSSEEKIFRDLDNLPENIPYLSLLVVRK